MTKFSQRVAISLATQRGAKRHGKGPESGRKEVPNGPPIECRQIGRNEKGQTKLDKRVSAKISGLTEFGSRSHKPFKLRSVCRAATQWGV